MSPTVLSRPAACFALGAVVGTALDGIHVYGDVLSYSSPDFGRWAWFVPIEFGLVAVLGYFVVLAIERGSRPVTAARAAGELVLFACLYGATALLDGDGAPFLAAGLGLLALARLALGDGGDLPYVVIAAIAGPLGEALISATDAFSYANPDLIGIPCWLPALWANGGFLIRRVLKLLAPGPPARTAEGRS